MTPMTTTITRSTLRRSAALLAAAGLAAALGACSSDDQATDASSGAEGGSGGDAAIKVVTSTNTWSDVAKAVVGDADVSVTPIIDSNEADPHSYEPSAQDMALIEQADIVVAGGGHYDVWMTSAAQDTNAVIVSALAPDEHGHDHDHHHGHDHDHGSGSLVELALAITSVAVAGVVLVRSYVRKHRDWRPLGLLTVSVAALVVSGFTMWRSQTAEMSVTAAGFAGLVAAQLVNMALVRRRNPCCAETRC